MKKQNHVAAYVKKHQKKFLFIGGTVFGAVLFKVIAVLAVAGLIWHPHKLNVMEKQALEIFAQIHDISHERDALIHSYYKKSWPLDNEYHKLVIKYHKADDIIEQYQIAKELDKIIHEQDEFLNTIGHKDEAGDKIFHDLEVKFDALR